MEKVPIFRPDPRHLTGVVDQLDENIVDHVSHRSRNRGLSSGSKATYRSIIRSYNQFLAAKGLHVCQESLQLYFDQIAGRYSASTLNLRKYALLKVIKAQIGEDSLLRQMAIEKAFEKIDHYQTEKAIARDACLTEDQVQSIIAAAYTRKTELMIRFLFVTGCRVSEMRNVRLSDCEPKNGYVTIPLMGKGKKERSVYIPTECAL